MTVRDLYDPGLHLFVDDAEIQDHPGFVRKVQQPARMQVEPVLRADQPWEGRAVQMWGSVLYDRNDNLFKMWYFTHGPAGAGNEGQKYICYATSPDGVGWHKPELGICVWRGSKANNIVYPTPETPPEHGSLHPWGIIKDDDATDPQRSYRMGYYQERPGNVPRAGIGAAPEARRRYFASVLDRHGMYTAHSPDGIHWTLDEEPAIPRSGDGGAVLFDPGKRRYIAVSRRAGTIADHFILQWKQYRKVVALSTSADFTHWTPMQTVLKPDDLDDERDQFELMTPFVYGNQYVGFLAVFYTGTGQGATELATARDIMKWSRVARREAFLPIGSPGAWDNGWVSSSLNPPILKDNTLHIWYSGMRRHGSDDRFQAAIGLATLRKDGFVGMCTGGGGELMTEPVRVEAPRLFLNASVFGTKGSSENGRILVRVVCDAEVPDGYGFEACNGLTRDDQTDFEITWGTQRNNPGRFVDQTVRLHFRVDGPGVLYSYRFGS